MNFNLLIQLITSTSLQRFAVHDERSALALWTLRIELNRRIEMDRRTELNNNEWINTYINIYICKWIMYFNLVGVVLTISGM